MKYIRTKCNIFEVIEETDLVYRVIGASREKNNVYSKSKCQTEVIKQADTIEELCDCFVKIKRKGNCKPYILKFDYKDLTTLKEQAIKYKDSPVYGAIHIEDKGLIYVAKKNEKGELELI